MMLDKENTGGASLSIDNGVAMILFNRVQARNAMLYETWCALAAMITKAEVDPQVGVIVIRGAGGHFGAGNDIAGLGELRRDATQSREFARAMASAMFKVERARKPVVAVIEGNCYGASLALMLATDFRIATTTARFAVTPAKLGAVLLRSDFRRLVTAIGQGQTRRMILTAAAVDAAEAASMGLVEQLVQPDQLDKELDLLLQSIRRGSRGTLCHSRRMLRDLGAGVVSVEDDESLDCFVDAMQGADFSEGYTAFMEKRAPNFSRPQSSS